ncbi:MAG TPA: hypothetical protein VFM25_06030 [Verrucomicrobiae bacterium]|nr:hypothetical protein [Verrucomicrobiae bacterium]
MNSNRIRERWQQDARPFTFHLSDGTRVPVTHPDFMMMPPGAGLIIVYSKNGGIMQIDPLHVVAIEEPPSKKKTNGKHSR